MHGGGVHGRGGMCSRGSLHGRGTCMVGVCNAGCVCVAVTRNPTHIHEAARQILFLLSGNTLQELQ